MPRRDVTDAARLIGAGGLVAFPTETVYGLGADARSPEAVARIFATKGRPQFNPLIAHVATHAQAIAEAEFSDEATRLAAHFWPGPLTLVLPRRREGSVCDLACAGLPTVGLRIPDQPTALALLRAAACPIAAPSANRSGRLSPTSADHVAADLGARVDMILDDGSCAVGVESTIVACLDDEIALLRPGAIGRESIEAVLGRQLVTAVSAVIAPGMLASHYAPDARVRLGAREVREGEVGLDFAGQLGSAAQLDLSAGGSLTEAAANLYRHLRTLDRPATGTIAVATIPDQGLGSAINDRLRRAAAPRPETT